MGLTAATPRCEESRHLVLTLWRAAEHGAHGGVADGAAPEEPPPRSPGAARALGAPAPGGGGGSETCLRVGDAWLSLSQSLGRGSQGPGPGLIPSPSPPGAEAWFPPGPGERGGELAPCRAAAGGGCAHCPLSLHIPWASPLTVQTWTRCTVLGPDVLGKAYSLHPLPAGGSVPRDRATLQDRREGA